MSKTRLNDFFFNLQHFQWFSTPPPLRWQSPRQPQGQILQPPLRLGHTYVRGLWGRRSTDIKQVLIHDLPTDKRHIKVPQNWQLCPTHVDKKKQVFEKKNPFKCVTRPDLSGDKRFNSEFSPATDPRLLNLQMKSQDYGSSNWRVQRTSRTKHLAIRLRNVVAMYNLAYFGNTVYNYHWTKVNVSFVTMITLIRIVYKICFLYLFLDCFCSNRMMSNSMCMYI